MRRRTKRKRKRMRSTKVRMCGVDGVRCRAGLFWCRVGILSHPSASLAPTTRGQREEGWRVHGTNEKRAFCERDHLRTENRRDVAQVERRVLRRCRSSENFKMYIVDCKEEYNVRGVAGGMKAGKKDRRSALLD